MMNRFNGHLLGVDFKNNQTTKQLNKSIWYNRKKVQFCFYLLKKLSKERRGRNCMIFAIKSTQSQFFMPANPKNGLDQLFLAL